MNFKFLISASIVLVGCSTAFASDVKYDKSVAEAAAKKAAEKIGEIRPSIDFDKQPNITEPKKEVQKETTEQEASEAETRHITESENRPAELQRISETEQDDLDFTATGSIERSSLVMATKVIWEKFDADGNPIR